MSANAKTPTVPQGEASKPMRCSVEGCRSNAFEANSPQRYIRMVDNERAGDRVDGCSLGERALTDRQRAVSLPNAAPQRTPHHRPCSASAVRAAPLSLVR